MPTIAVLLRHLAIPSAVVAGTVPRAAAAAPEPVLMECANTLEVPLPANTVASHTSLRDGAAIFGVTQTQPGGTGAIHVLDLATQQVAALSGFSPNHDEVWPEFVTDDFLVYHRWLRPSGNELRGRWRGPDATWATADDLDWAFDTTVGGSILAGFTPVSTNDGEVAYVYFGGPGGGLEVRHCEFVLGSPRPCLPGYVVSEPIAAGGQAFPIFGGATLLDDFSGATSWIDPGQPAVPWAADMVTDTQGPFVASRDAAGDISIRLAINPSIPPIWKLNAQTWDPQLSPTPGSNNNMRVAWTDGVALTGYVADLGLGTPALGVLSRPPASVAPDGDDIAYVTVTSSPPYQWNIIAVDACVF